jgi:hypothetical protein
MAELPRYKSSGLQVAAPEGQFRDVSAPMDALSKGMNQMTSFFMQSAQEQAVVEGEKYGAENAPSLEQIANARKLNEPLKPVAEQFTYFGRAATETSNRILAKNISADADMALEKLSARISSGEIPINQITSQTNALIQGYSTVLKDINPALGRSVEADLALSGNRMFLAASKAAAAEALAEQQKKVAETVEKTLPSAVAQIFKTGTIEVAGGLTLSVDAQLEIAKSKAQNMINSLPPKQRKAMTEKLDGFIATAAGDSIDQSLVSGTLEELRGVSDNIKNGVYKTSIKDPGDQLTYLNKVKSQISSLETEGDRVKAGTRLSITQKLEDVSAALAAGKSLLSTDIPSQSSIMENFEGAQLKAALESRDNLVAVYSSIADLGNKPASQVNTMLKQLETELKTGPVEGSEAKSKQYQAVSAAVESRNKAIQADPGLYVRGNFSEVRGAYENMLQDSTPENVRGYVTLSTNAQLSLGIRPENVALLPKAQADNIVNGFNNQVASGVNYADYLMTLQDTWGAAFPQVLKQLGKDLPAEVGVVASLNERDRTAAQTLANALQPQNLKALKESVPTDASKSISNAVDTAMVSFRDSLFNSASLNGSVEFEKYNSAVNILAQTYVARGEAPATAAQKAYEKVIGSAYRFGDGYRIPMAVDQNRIITTTSLLLKNIEKYEIQSPVSILGFTPQQAKDQYVSSLVANGRWVNTPDERFGLRLVDQNGSPVMLANGKMFELPWTVLSKEYGGMVTPSGGRGTGARTTEGKFVPPELFP